MRITLNLATQPFARTRLFWLLSGISGVVLAAAAVWLLTLFFQESEIPPELLVRERQLRSDLNDLSASERRLRATLEEPANGDVLERSLFLNELLYRKGISWTRTFADLEMILPPRVQMFQIRPQVTADRKVVLDMQVGAETPKDFIELLKALESSQAFGAVDLRGNSPPTENQPLFRYQLMVSYDQQL